MTKLILIRHGETKGNLAGRLHHANAIEELTKKGLAQIEATAQVLKKYNPNIIYSSRELRAKESAQMLANILDIPLELASGFEERNWGDFSGEFWNEVEAVLKNMPIEQRYTYVPPRGESWKDTEDRLIETLHKILPQNENKTVVIVSHAGAIRILIPHLLNLSKEETFKYSPDNASITVFEFKNNKFTKHTVNDTSHLKDIK